MLAGLDAAAGSCTLHAKQQQAHSRSYVITACCCCCCCCVLQGCGEGVVKLGLQYRSIESIPSESRGKLKIAFTKQSFISGFPLKPLFTFIPLHLYY
jgi:hypothetical protein